MRSSIVEHWRKLAGPVHPLDEPFFERFRHNFNLDYPPPAYIGDIESAPVVLLEAHGGYGEEVTPAEFADPGTAAMYLRRLYDPGPVVAEKVAPYYGERNYADLIASGVLALVNAVAYRTPDMSKEASNRKLVERLPSTAVHRTWLKSELLSQVARGERLVVANRSGLWDLQRSGDPVPGLVFTPNPRMSDLDRGTLEYVHNWLTKKCWVR